MIKQKLTPEDVLNIFIEEHRLCSPLDCMADPNVTLTAQTTVVDWQDARDLLPWRQLSDFLNKEFNISASQQEWKSVLKPSCTRTLQDVCTFISERTMHKDVKPLKRLGMECLSAAVFLTLKKYLQRRGVDVTLLRPSSLVGPYLENHFSAMIEQINILSRGGQVFQQLDYERKKSGFFNTVNVLDKDRYRFLTGDILTFRDITNRIIALNEK